MNLPGIHSCNRKQVEDATKTVIFFFVIACAFSMAPSDAHAADKKKAAFHERTYSFRIESATYAELIHEFARQAGIGLVGATTTIHGICPLQGRHDKHLFDRQKKSRV